MNDISIEKEMRNFLHNLLWLKDRYEFSEEKMAEILGISVELWEEVELEKIPTSLRGDVFYKIKEFFDINPSDLINKKFEE